jgi:F0F1-type ATP synthase beta subunit
LHGGYTVCTGLEDGAYAARNLMLVWRSCDANRTPVHVFGQGDDPASTRLHIAETGLTNAKKFRSQGHDVLLLADCRVALVDGVLPYLKDNALSTAETVIATVYYGDHTVGAKPPALADLEAVLTFDQARAKRGVWTAIDPLRPFPGSCHRI